MFTVSEISNQLKDLGLKDAMTVMLHVSYRRLGKVETGPGGVIRSIQGVIGSGGTVLMVLGSEDGQVFDPVTTRADPEMGIVAETFRTMPGVLVNNHPAARFAALGDKAEYLLNPTPWHDYYGPGSVLERFLHADGYVLRLEPDIDTTTVTHYVEYQANLTAKSTVTRRYTTLTGIADITSLDDCQGIQNWSGGDYFSKIMEEYLGANIPNCGTVGNCHAHLFSAKKYCEFAKLWMEKHLK